MKLETKRLLLRPATATDVDALRELWTHPDVRRFLWDDEVISRELAAETVKAMISAAEEEGLGLWLVFERGQAELIGFVGLRHPEDSSEVELLYGLDPSAWGKGYATEASKAMIDYGFDKLSLPRIVAGADPPNVASIRVMDRLGMRELPGGIPAVPGAEYRFLDKP